MIKLQSDKCLIIKPRWPYKAVFITQASYDALMKAQSILNARNIKLGVTRGYENQGIILKIVHRVGRILGATFFFLVYPGRKKEIREIFSANGHDKDGNSVDISVLYENEIINFLPYGVFTSRKTIECNRHNAQAIIDAVYDSLKMVGFSIHANQTEALQIHCELNI